MSYVSAKGHDSRPPVDGVILQAAVSDRDVIEDTIPLEQIEKLNSMARDHVKAGNPKAILPYDLTSAFFGAKITAYRWLSFACRPKEGGDDDFFSNDLTEEENMTTFGVIAQKKVPLLIVCVRLEICC